MAPSLQAERELVGENELEELRKDGGQRVSEGPRERGTRRTRGWAAHQSCVWWLEIRDRIARGDCSLPKGYGHECVCVCVRGGGLLRVSLWGLHSLSVMYFMAPSSSDRGPTLYTLSTLLPIVRWKEHELVR